MIPVIEEYLNKCIVEGIDRLYNNPKAISRILDIAPSRVQSLQKHLHNNANKPIPVINGYPRTPAELPCICIMLSKEEESQSGLGDYFEEEIYYEESEPTLEECEVLVDHIGRYYEVSNKPITNVLCCTDEFGDIIPIDNIDFLRGKIRVDQNFTDTLTVEYVYKNLTEESMEIKYSNSYRIEVWTTNADLTVELYHLVKWILLSSRDYLSDEKLLRKQSVGGGDLEPSPSYMPVFVYRRSLTFSCESLISAPTNMVSFIDGVVTNETVY